jgi:hypothetical protein
MPKISELNPLTSLSNDDLVPVVNDPNGAPSNNKITFDNFANSVLQNFNSKNIFDVLLSAANTGNVSFSNTTISTKHVGQDIRIDPQGGNVYIGTDKNLVFDINAFTGKGILLIDSSEDGYDDPNIPSVLNVGSIYHDTGTMVIRSDGSITNVATQETVDVYGQLLLTNKDTTSYVRLGLPADTTLVSIPELPLAISKTIVHGDNGVVISPDLVNSWKFDQGTITLTSSDTGDEMYIGQGMGPSITANGSLVVLGFYSNTETGEFWDHGSISYPGTYQATTFYANNDQYSYRESTVTLRSDNSEVSARIYLEDSHKQVEWIFDSNGNINLPANGNILDSNGYSVLGGLEIDGGNASTNYISEITVDGGGA